MMGWFLYIIRYGKQDCNMQIAHQYRDRSELGLIKWSSYLKVKFFFVFVFKICFAARPSPFFLAVRQEEMMMGETRWALPFKIGFTPTIVQPTTFDAEVLKVGHFHPQGVFLILKIMYSKTFEPRIFLCCDLFCKTLIMYLGVF